jgi:hypothetical protein
VTSHSGDASAVHAREKEITNITVTFDGPDDPLNPQNWPASNPKATLYLSKH